MSVFHGYSQRAIDHFRKEGLDNSDELHVLELLLLFSVPQTDTYLLAHELLSRFGSLPQVMEAPMEELEKVPGVNEKVSTLISLNTAVSRYCMVRRGETFAPLTTIDDCARHLMPFFEGRRDEMVFLLCLDAKGKAICCREVGRGSVDSVSISIRRIVEIALDVNAISVILAHNHPGGEAIPSRDDIVVTMRLAKALDGVAIRLADHIVIADKKYVSMEKYGYYRPEECHLIP